MASRNKPPLIVGLTGGIGSGKSTVCNMFEGLGAEVIDADLISRELLQPGTPELKQVIAHFGQELLQDNHLDRARLRALVFADTAARTWLEQLLHPRIREEILRRIARSTSPWVLLAAPLLLENKAYDFVDLLVVVDAPEELQLARTSARDKSNIGQIAAIMATQMSRADRLQQADYIIHNDADLAQLQRQAGILFQHIEAEAHARLQTG
jgi:dephospho-CoA kinase